MERMRAYPPPSKHPHTPTPPNALHQIHTHIPERVNGAALELPARQAGPVRGVLKEEGGLARRLGDAAGRGGAGPAAAGQEQEQGEQEAATAGGGGGSLPPLLRVLLWWLHGCVVSGARTPLLLQRQAIEKEAACLLPWHTPSRPWWCVIRPVLGCFVGV